MAKKKKRRIQAPSLSVLDKGIYYCLIAFSCVAGLFLYPAIIGNFRKSIFQDTHILAQGSPSVVILVLFGLFMGGGFALAFDWLRRKKQPIFGKCDVNYEPPQWKTIYPLLSKQFWFTLYSNKKRMVLGGLCVLAFIIAVVFVTMLGLTPRECLYDDGSISVYNCFNEKTAEYSHSDVEEIRIYTRTYHDRRGSDDWGIEMKLSMKDGEEFIFPYRDFQTTDDKVRGSITGMYQIKTCFDPSIITIDGKENVAYVACDMYLNQQEVELLYMLFEAGEPTYQ
jgi:hypothetical protein